MSEISMISRQYKVLAETTDKINSAIIAFKKQFLIAQDGNQNIQTIALSEGELKLAKQDLLNFIAFLFMMTEDKSITNFDIIPQKSSGDFYKKVVKKATFRSDLQEVRIAIETDHKLNLKQFDFLDEIVSTLDNERTVLFKKLRTARG
jgi:hypothetical protein